jgi:hypothetical protein
VGVLDEFKKVISNLSGKSADVSTSYRGVAQITPDDVPEHALADLWTLHDRRMPKTPKRIQDSIDLLSGEKRAPMPPEFDQDDREAFRADGASKYTQPKDIARRLGAKRPRTKRPTAGASKAADRASTGIEQFAEGAMRKYPYGPSIKTLAHEGELFLFVSPTPTYWERIPTIFDDDQAEGPHLTDDEYGALPEHQQNQYELFMLDPTDDPDGDLAAEGSETADDGDESAAPTQEARYKRIKQRYRVDAEGNPDDGSDQFSMDRSESNAFYRDEMSQAFGKKLPLVYELVSRLDAIPINPRWSGDGVEIDGVIRRTLFSRSELLRRGYRYSDCDEQLEPQSARDGRDGDFWLYELRTRDEFGRPFIVYQVGERASTSYGDSDTAVIKLWEEYPGVDDILVHFEYGEHWAFSDPDIRSMPITKAYMQDWLGRDAALTGLIISMWGSGFPSWGQKITKESLALAEAGDISMDVRVRSNSVVPLIGDLVELTPRGSNLDVKTVLGELGTDASENLPSQGAFGGDGPTSGVDREVVGRDMEVAYGDIIEAARRMYEAGARFTLMVCSALAKKAGRPVELWIMSDTPVAQSGKQTTSYSVVTLSADQCGGNFDVTAEFPHVPGENLAATSLFQGLAKDQLILREEFRTLWGDPSPEIFEAKLRLQRFYDSPEGQADLMQGLAEYLADQKMAQLLKLQSAGKVTQGGVSTAAMGDLMGAGGGGQTAAPDMSIQNPGPAALGGMTQGALQASARSAGGPLDGMSAGGGAGMGLAA